MQCVNLLKKRSLEPEMEPWGCRAKRACLEAELQAAECPMETRHTFSVTNQQRDQRMDVTQPRPQLCCPRCLAGEPGHINHILGL
ncbi:hypothetical protein EXN66_Car019662 [Channa argus]|uniref:Uncharacterized protein n=1 Tax=Channa argus TaxID=215402 RepID=A0A6G1QNB9_CHAAH|nr:hypothetical protein EXN66_Car019662 [Channa argus]KAK2884340.1 hypothetical protein Q8A73_020814 [Channa argus]